MCSTRAPGVPRLLAWLLGPLALFRLSPAQGCVPGLTKWVGWGRLRESNSRPTHYECVALPSELRRRVHGRQTAHARSPTISTLRAHVEAAARAASPAATADGQLSTGGTQTSHRRAQEGGPTPAHERPPGERRDHERPAEPLPRAHPGERSGAGPPVVTAAATRPNSRRPQRPAARAGRCHARHRQPGGRQRGDPRLHRGDDHRHLPGRGPGRARLRVPRPPPGSGDPGGTTDGTTTDGRPT